MQLHIQQHQVRLLRQDRSDSLFAGRVFADDLNLFQPREPVADSVAHERFVIDDQQPE
jgi:hypothetical protein